MISKILYLFTRTPLHVGAGASVGAIDQPIQRERHTGFPIIPATGLKGSFADQWPNEVLGSDGKTKQLKDKDGKSTRITTTKVKERDSDAEATKVVPKEVADSAWLFGSDTTDLSFAGSLTFSEARLLAFPIRSAKGSYAWITCPLMLQRAARDGVFGVSSKNGTGEEQNKLLAAINVLKEPKDDEARYGGTTLDLDRKIVLEEYCFKQTPLNNAPEALPDGLTTALAALVPNDALFGTITDRLVILSNGMMSHFAITACEVAQHVRICDETGTADPGGLFNQENVPADTLFYSVLSATKSRVPDGRLKYQPAQNNQEAKNDSDAALQAFADKTNGQVFQFGGDASTGLGYCTVRLA